MMTVFLVGTGAGVAAALLYASIVSGAVVALLLVQLAPLPILIAAMGWSHMAGLLAAVIAASGLGLAFGFYIFFAFLFGTGLPAWWLGYLALLARTTSTNGAGTVEWYPVGRLVLWAALIATLLTALTVIGLGIDKAGYQAELRNVLERSLRARMKQPELLDGPEGRRLIDLVVATFPPIAAALLTVIHGFNLWLAARIVKVSDRLRRPWPDLSTLSLPPSARIMLAIAIVGSFLPDLVGLLSRLLAAGLFMAYAIMGFAVLHFITRGVSGRAFMLSGTYAAVILLIWPLLAMSLLGLAETTFNIRARFAAKGGPPAPTLVN